MRNLFTANLDDPHYTDAELVADVQSFIDSGVREGVLVDYKEDLSDAVLETVAALSNTSGGLVLPGVAENNGLPTAITGMVRGSGDLKTRLTNMIWSTITLPPLLTIAVADLREAVGRELAVISYFRLCADMQRPLTAPF